MINHELFDLFWQDNINKEAKIECGGVLMTNEELFQNSESLEESLCSEKELRFGCCEASCFKFKVANIVRPLIGETVRYSIVIDHKKDSALDVGQYKVVSDKLTADRRHREIVAYDAMYDILNADVAEWYNTALPDDNSSMVLKEFRESFIRHFGLTEVVPKGGLVNDGMEVKKTIMPEQISGKDVITAICEINGCFGHIGRDGKFHYIYLSQAIQGLWPADDLFPNHAPKHLPEYRLGTLYPHDPKSTRLGNGTYISCKYEDFVTQTIDKLQIRQEADDIGLIYGSGNNCYIIEDNFLVYGKSSDQLQEIAANIYGKIVAVVYRPFSAQCSGNPCMEVGDPVRLLTKFEIVESYILKRTIKGVQALRDDYSADGVEQYGEKVNGVHKFIIQLKGKANILTRTIEETRLEMYDIEKGLETNISVTAAGIRADVAKTYETKTDAAIEYTSIKNSISIEAGKISSEIERATKAEQSLSGEITSTVTTLNSKIEQTASSITAEVTRATNAENALSSRVSITESGIATKVSKGNISSEISQEAGKISLNADRLSWHSTYSSMEEDGTFTTSKANITGGSVEIFGATMSETRIAVRYTDAYAMEMSSSGISGHLKYHDGTIKRWFTLGPTFCYISPSLALGIDYSDVYIWNKYALYVGGTKNAYIANTLELDCPAVVGSDENLIGNVKYLSDLECLENILKIRQTEFSYGNSMGVKRHGIIAQDAETEFAEGWNPVRQMGEYLGVAYEEIIADLIGAVKYLAKEISA